MGYDEEIPSNSHFYMYSKYQKKKQTAGNDSGDDDDDVGGGDAADDNNTVADTCRDSSDIMDLYNPCTSDTATGLFTNFNTSTRLLQIDLFISCSYFILRMLLQEIQKVVATLEKILHVQKSTHLLIAGK